MDVIWRTSKERRNSVWKLTVIKERFLEVCYLDNGGLVGTHRNNSLRLELNAHSCNESTPSCCWTLIPRLVWHVSGVSRTRQVSTCLHSWQRVFVSVKPQCEYSNDTVICDISNKGKIIYTIYICSITSICIGQVTPYSTCIAIFMNTVRILGWSYKILDKILVL